VEADDLVRAVGGVADLGDRQPEVLEARIAWPGVAASSSEKTPCLTSIRSGTASIAKSTSPKPS
jgi:hypothetical protein